MLDAIAARRSALMQIEVPKDADYKALCNRETLDLIASFRQQWSPT